MHREKHGVVSRNLVAPDRALGTANAVQSLLLVEKSPWGRARAERLRRTKPLVVSDMCTVELGDRLVGAGALKGSDGMVYPIKMYSHVAALVGQCEDSGIGRRVHRLEVLVI